MTDDQIIGLANLLIGKTKKEDTAKLIRFAKGVALFEREECLELLEQLKQEHTHALLFESANGLKTAIDRIRSRT